MEITHVNMEQFGADAELCSNKPCVATVGFFDGVHLGHRHLIGKMREYARQRGMETVVVTFECHPRQVLDSTWQPRLLSSLEEKMHLLAQTGIDRIAVLRFDRQMASLSAYDFMQLILKERLGVKTLFTGYDNRFGHQRSEGFADYVDYGKRMGMEVLQADELNADGLKVSSSAIRSHLAAGDVAKAAQCLGHPYFMAGTIVKGYHIGTGIGFPTANLQPDEPLKLIPAPGVYAVKVQVGDSPEMRNAMMNIGCRPTFHGERQTIEAHILHFEGDIYGQHMRVWWVQRLRDEQRFGGREALVAQLRQDAEAAERCLNDYEIRI